jgi:AcrR family transcriptional regulator
MNEKLDHLLKQAGDIFMRYGLKSVTMDDVCRELGISKKTLYQYVSDKNDLIAKVLDQDIQEDEKVICALQTSGLSAIDELLHIQKMVTEKVQHMHSSIIYDLKKLSEFDSLFLGMIIDVHQGTSFSDSEFKILENSLSKEPENSKLFKKMVRVSYIVSLWIKKNTFHGNPILFHTIIP